MARLKRIEDAAETFDLGWAAETKADDDLKEVKKAVTARLEAAKRKRGSEVDQARRQQGTAAQAIRDEGCSVEEVAHTLLLEVAQVRQLLKLVATAGKEPATSPTRASESEGNAEPAPAQVTVEQAEYSSGDRTFSPAVIDDQAGANGARAVGTGVVDGFDLR